MIFRKPASLEEAELQLELLEDLVWRMYHACLGPIIADNCRIADAKSQGKAAGRTHVGRQSLAAVKEVDRIITCHPFAAIRQPRPHPSSPPDAITEKASP